MHAFGVPFQKLVEEAYPPDPADKGYRDKMRKVINMVYVGVVASACGLDMDQVRHAIRLQFPGRKAKAGEINIRAAAILGVVGAGGIGFSLDQTIKFHRYPLAGTAIIVVVVATIAVDLVSGWVRRRIIEGSGGRRVIGDEMEEPSIAGAGAGKVDTAAG